MERVVRYCTSGDGVRIAYCVEGEGPPLVITSYILESFSLHNLFPSFADFMREVASGHTAIRYDARGTGLSQRTATGFTQDAVAGDLEAVVDAAGLETFALFGSCAGGQGALSYAHRHPERVKRLALYGSFPGVRHLWTPEMMRSFCDLARANWPMAVRAFGDISLRDVDPEKATQQGEMMLQSLSGETFATASMASYEWDLVPILSEVKVPTLIVHRLDDTGVPFRLAQEMAAIIPNARLVPVPGKANQPAGGDPRPILDALRSFFDEDPETRRRTTGDESSKPTVVDRPHQPLPSGTAIILFADIVDSTALTERLGDTVFRDKARGLDEAMRAAIRDNAGTPVEGKLLGDGVLAVFTSARQAIEAALACGRAGEDASFPLHLGLHAGDVIRDEGNVFGGAVNIAARVSALSEPGQLLVSDTVRSLARTSADVQFDDKGEHSLKGIEEPVRVYEVSWRE